MVKVLVYPANSLILADLVDRFGHEPLSVQQEVREKISAPGLDSPPLNITPEDPKIGLRYAAVEVPSGVRGRMALLGPLIEEAEAAIVVHDPDPTFGCMGCARTNELVNFLIRAKKIPLLEVKYPSTEDNARDFVVRVAEFLKSLGNEK
ncbi:methanogenesis marker 5 protein [Methanosarcinales archaeon ex4572_44]|nr:MAG: methanogenesis marker 5 protein [Methanosarcinales archaeon ex4484_138]PHP45220.1 MAG: methanogenesis marker 5 protein [Methanosarcinales archaeon ex4572_44]RLG26103.1 MAG: methanogenesis marker 5 protein [Methanosarcinales archaeon]RLG27472.1 MAG: methanogenesis marker 5 protein [Methanosarcinales archaeon]